MQVSQKKGAPRTFSRTPVAAGIVLALASPTLVAQEDGDFVIEEIITTAQKREQSLQDVPISIQMLGNEAIQELNLTNFKDYTQMLPSVAIQQSAGAGAGFARVYMRGIATSGDGQATTSQPSVGMYLDELPITTIQGNIDVHMYDIARVEALAGPQGTLYGASSQAGTLRVITNKPQLGEVSSSVSVGVNSVDQGGTGYTVEGYVNAPIGENAAIRLVGWSRNDAGWIDNVEGSRTFRGIEDEAVCAAAGVPCSADDITLTNTDKAKKDYNTLDTIGARAALKIDLNDNWTVSPTLMYQKSESEGAWVDDLSDFVDGDYAVTHFKDEFFDDEWAMLGMTIEGTVGSFDIVYAGSYLDREVEGSTDYSDYSYWYSELLTSGYYAGLHFSPNGTPVLPNYFVPAYFDAADVGTRVMTGAAFTNDDGYTKTNHELRISTDPSKRVRGLLGIWSQKQYHDFEQMWEVEGGVAPTMQMNGGDPNYADTVYLNSMFRTDRDTAYFGSVSFDVTDDVEMTFGARFFEPEVHVKGFFGFPTAWRIGANGTNVPASFNLWGTDGETQCDAVPGGDGEWDEGATDEFNGQTDWKGKPCLNVDKTQKESDSVFRANVSWNVSDDNMVYFTWSEGYRPGGIQRRPTLGEYESDFLTNTEIGWKTQWADNRFQFNGAVFTQDWDDIQIGLTGENAITLVDNGPSASVDGVEVDMLWLATEDLRISVAAAFYDSELEDDYCCESDDVTPLAPAGTRLPLTADMKYNIVARYHFEMGGLDSYVQGVVVHEDDRDSRLARFKNDIIGTLESYTTVDVSAGVARDNWAVDLFVSNLTGEDATLYRVSQCIPATCANQVYGARIRPTTISARFTMDFD